MDRGQAISIKDTNIQSDIDNPSTWPNTLFISIPLAEIGYARFWQQLHTVKGYGWHVQQGLWNSQSGSYIHDTHTRLVKDALKIKGWKRLVFLEHDHEFTADMLFRHSQYTQPIVSGFYVQRRLDEPLPVIYRWDAGRHNALRPSAEEMKQMILEKGLYEMDVVPMGCTSIRRDVLENWPEDVPMFFSPVNPATGSTMSDDVWFCRKAQDMAYPIYVDTSLRVGHLVLHPIDDGFFTAWWVKEVQKEKEEMARELEDTNNADND